jgi:hypothetical protein
MLSFIQHQSTMDNIKLVFVLLAACSITAQALVAVPLRTKPSPKIFHGHPDKLRAWGINSSINTTLPLGGNLTYFAEYFLEIGIGA